MKNIDFGNGLVIYDDFNIDILKPIENQLLELKEDLSQVHYSDEYSNTYILDMAGILNLISTEILR